MVNSVLGPLSSKDLGFTLMHEHIISLNTSMAQTFSKWYNRQETKEKAVEELRYAKQQGLHTIVDATPINLGRDIRLLKEVAQNSGVNIVASTGLYWVDEPFLFGWEIDRLVDLLLKEVNEGIQGTNIKPGVIKCATETTVTPHNEKILRMTGRLQKESELPIITHSSSVIQNGKAQLDILLDEDVDVSRLVIGHCGDTTDLDYLETLLESGCYIGLDRYGLDSMLPMDSRIQICVDLIEKGYEDQIVFSHDYCVFIDWFPQDVLRNMRLDPSNKWSFHHILVDIIPLLLKKGVSQKYIDQITLENPIRILT